MDPLKAIATLKKSRIDDLVLLNQFINSNVIRNTTHTSYRLPVQYSIF